MLHPSLAETLGVKVVSEQTLANDEQSKTMETLTQVFAAISPNALEQFGPLQRDPSNVAVQLTKDPEEVWVY